MGATPTSPRERGAVPNASLGARALLAIGIAIFLGQFVSEEMTGTNCNETANFNPGTKGADSCGFLSDVGYTLIALVPPLIAAAFAAAGFWKGRAGLIWAGFGIAFVLLLFAGFVAPSDYPWANGHG